ncbi:lysozyme [Pseudomonas sp. gcc21]|uniref:lysozyme n=1 Tax=Pseudomonas sp. gcc21 TaxID=2726989 RepID=UPI0014511869|nr:lysozyme [Pseudomonas sp. gcc21]QJD58186.1 lysozyme [Pseudomonas sp. gcc21]
MNIVQKSLIAGSAAIAATIVGYFEGRELVGYLDPVGIPTVCYGHTATAELDQVMTEAECEALLLADLGHALATVDAQLPGLPPATRAALGSFVYNVGSGAFQGSTLVRKARNGDLIGACNELPRWVYAGGRKLNGLVRRREAERQLCLEGVRNEPNPVESVRPAATGSAAAGVASRPP